MVKTVGKYDLYGTLGEGAFGKVKYAVNTETNEAVAIKILDKDKIQTRNMGAQIKKEISIMKMINHHHVVGVRDVFATSAKIFIVLEFVGGGELFDKIANEGKLPEDKARFYFKQLVEGLDHCHSNGVCHRDLKPENLLLDTEGNLKISDFGFSTLNIGDADGDGGARAELLHTTCGTPNYVAPEVLGKDGYDGKKADVWSIGVILYVLLAGYLPFDENTMVALFQKIKNADFEYPDWFSEEARDLLAKTLVPDPQARIRLSDMKTHVWMQHADSGPTPSQGDFSAAQAGAPPVVNAITDKHTDPTPDPATTPAAATEAPPAPAPTPTPAPTPVTAPASTVEPVVATPPPAPEPETTGHEVEMAPASKAGGYTAAPTSEPDVPKAPAGTAPAATTTPKPATNSTPTAAQAAPASTADKPAAAPKKAAEVVDPKKGGCCF